MSSDVTERPRSAASLESVCAAHTVVADLAEGRDGQFSGWTMLTLHRLRVRPAKFERETVNVLRERAGVVVEVGLPPPSHVTAL